MIYEEKTIETIPVGPLGLIPLKSCATLECKGKRLGWSSGERNARVSTNPPSRLQAIRDSYIIEAKTLRFGSGEGKGTIESSIRGDDLYIMVDVCNHNLTYSLRHDQPYVSG